MHFYVKNVRFLLYLLITVQPRTSHCAAKSVRMHSGLDASSQPRSGFCMAWCL